MRQITFLLPFLFYINVSISQNIRANPYLHIPDSLTNTTGNIAGYINTHLSGEEEDKVSAIYNWVISNLKYE